MNKINSSSGFTLIEIAITIIIIGVLVTLAIPNLSGALEKSRSGEGLQILDSLLSAQRIYQFETGSYTDDINDLDVNISEPVNFIDPPTVDDDAGALATVTRVGNTYSLSIDSNGTITCAGGLCATIGCTGAGNACN